MKIGARIIKTGLVITISLAICKAINLGPAIFAAITAMVNLQPSIYQSYKNAKEQIGVTGLGIFVGTALLLTLGNSPVVVGLASMIIIILALQLKWKSVVQVGIVTTIFVMDGPGVDLSQHIVDRVMLIGIGLSVALTVNLTLAPPNQRKKVLAEIEKFHYQVMELFNREVENYIKTRPITSEELERQLELVRESVRLEKSIKIWEISAYGKGAEEEVYLTKKLFDLNVHVLDKIALFQDVVPNRNERRSERGNQPYSSQFQEIVNGLNSARNTIDKNGRLLVDAIIRDREVKALYPTDEFGSDLDDKLEMWHSSHLGDNYYLHALMEVSILIYEMRWIDQKQRKLFLKQKEGLRSQVDQEVSTIKCRN
ncbi:uncharacterized membrane protein YgaE (UPF0421/DUF939 family) [Desulfitispora alkaliphila]|uniref:FUSC family protein n=1 Tax=Desulfitispora alkaliphila TaxID=622674 RepID=UPI003D1F4C31